MKPKKRHTKSRSRKRKSAISLKPTTLSACPKCKKPLKPHTACSFCGTYKEKKVLKIRIKKADRKKKMKEEKKEKKQEKKK
ncbi:MAG: 50S ribosomal protein L32 [Patescibacteria group bacterium]